MRPPRRRRIQPQHRSIEHQIVEALWCIRIALDSMACGSSGRQTMGGGAAFVKASTRRARHFMVVALATTTNASVAPSSRQSRRLERSALLRHPRRKSLRAIRRRSLRVRRLGSRLPVRMVCHRSRRHAPQQTLLPARIHHLRDVKKTASAIAETAAIARAARATGTRAAVSEQRPLPGVRRDPRFRPRPRCHAPLAEWARAQPRQTIQKMRIAPNRKLGDRQQLPAPVVPAVELPAQRAVRGLRGIHGWCQGIGAPAAMVALLPARQERRRRAHGHGLGSDAPKLRRSLGHSHASAAGLGSLQAEMLQVTHRRKLFGQQMLPRSDAHPPHRSQSRRRP